MKKAILFLVDCSFYSLPTVALGGVIWAAWVDSVEAWICHAPWC